MGQGQRRLLRFCELLFALREFSRAVSPRVAIEIQPCGAVSASSAPAGRRSLARMSAPSTRHPARAFEPPLRVGSDDRPDPDSAVAAPRMAATRIVLTNAAVWSDVAAEFRRSGLRRVQLEGAAKANLGYVPEAFSFGICPETFPAKVAALLFERYVAMHGDPKRGIVLQPDCECAMSGLGDHLRVTVLEHAQNWALPGAFAIWIRAANRFLDGPGD